MQRKNFDKAKELQSRFVDPLTQENYVAVLENLQKKNIPFILVQYPMRNVQALKNMLKDHFDIEHMVFVDNEQVFEDAIKNFGYDTYFIDRFGGNFGHCTPKGNKLLASRIADVIVDLLGKKGR